MSEPHALEERNGIALNDFYSLVASSSHFYQTTPENQQPPHGLPCSSAYIDQSITPHNTAFPSTSTTDSRPSFAAISSLDHSYQTLYEYPPPWMHRQPHDSNQDHLPPVSNNNLSALPSVASLDLPYPPISANHSFHLDPLQCQDQVEEQTPNTLFHHRSLSELEVHLSEAITAFNTASLSGDNSSIPATNDKSEEYTLPQHLTPTVPSSRQPKTSKTTKVSKRSKPIKHPDRNLKYRARLDAVNGIATPSIRNTERTTTSGPNPCPICGTSHTRPFHLQSHFITCAERNGNPEGYFWNEHVVYKDGRVGGEWQRMRDQARGRSVSKAEKRARMEERLRRIEEQMLLMEQVHVAKRYRVEG